MAVADFATSITGSFIAAPLHPQETARLHSLKSLNLLDTCANARFDAITTLAADVFDAPIALVSLVDLKRQWYLSRCGFARPQTARHKSFCAHAIHEDEILVVEDAMKSPVFSTNPMVAGEQAIRFYAGAVIRDTDGLPLGTLCIMDRRPRSLSERDQRRLIQFATLVREEMLLSPEANVDRIGQQIAAHRDPISQAYWGDTFFERCDSAASDDLRSRRVAAVLSLDNIDFLANTHDRLIADDIVINAVNLFRDACHNYGRLIDGRLDEKRFAMCIFLTGDQSPEEVASRLQSELETMLSGGVATAAGLITPRFSIAVAPFTNDEDSAAEIVKFCRLSADRISDDATRRSLLIGDAERIETTARFRVAADLTNAMRFDELRIELQPKVSTSTGRVTGAECLLRWQHPNLGEISPTEIVKAAKSSQKLLELDCWVLKKALQFISSCERIGSNYGRLSVNLSGFTLSSPSFPKWLELQLATFGVSGAALDIEILESAVFQDFEQILTAMRKIHELGVSFSLDDFGTGHSSLCYLRELPVDHLKIDKSFVRDIAQSKKAATLLKGITSLTHSLGMAAVAEGVETKAQYDVVKSLQCEQIQGWLFAKSMPPSDFIRYLSSPPRVCA
ncbi:MAG: GGDEF and EAL domain-containing protein [Pseudomonadota bacterium]